MMIQVYYAKASLMEREAFRRESRIYLFIIAISTAVAFFYQADKLFGAIGVLPFYTIPGLVLAVVFLLTALWLFAWHSNSPKWLALFLSIGLVGVAVRANVALVGLGWFFSILFFCLPSQIVFLGLCFAFVTWAETSIRFSMPKLKLLRSFVAIMMVFMAFYVLGLGSSPINSEFNMIGNISFKEKHYFLNLHWGYLGDADTMILYECNQFGVFCTEAYRQSGSYLTRTIELIPEIDKNDLVIRVDGSPLYTYQPKP